MVKINISLRAEKVEERYFSMEIVTTHLRNHLKQNPKKLYKWKSTPGNLMKNLFCGPFWNWYFKTVFWKLLSRSTLLQFSATVTTIHSFMEIFLKFLGIHITDATFRSNKVLCTIYIFATRLEYKICFSFSFPEVSDGQL